MDQDRVEPQLSEGGFASLQFVLAAALAMLLVVGLAQLIAYQYTRGAVLAAVERGVRAGSPSGRGAAECEAALSDSFDEVLGGSVGESTIYACRASPTRVVARASGSVPAWLPGWPAFTFDVEEMARREGSP